MIFGGFEDTEKLTEMTGNTYSIENDYDEPARVFFSQGCEPLQRPADLEEGSVPVEGS
jgi:centromere protein C